MYNLIPNLLLYIAQSAEVTALIVYVVQNLLITGDNVTPCSPFEVKQLSASSASFSAMEVGSAKMVQYPPPLS